MRCDVIFRIMSLRAQTIAAPIDVGDKETKETGIPFKDIMHGVHINLATLTDRFFSHFFCLGYIVKFGL